MGKLLDRSLDNLLAPLSSFPLSALPRDPATISVTVDGAPAAGFTYDPASNRIVFAAGSVPAPGSHLAANYEVACP